MASIRTERLSATPSDRLYRIVEEGLCIGCGLCQSVAGSNRISVHKAANGYLRPRVVGDLDHETVDRIYDVCPGTRLEGLPEDQCDEHTRTDAVWGPYQRLLRAHAANPEVRHRGATGGVLTALGQYLVDSGQAAFILHARASATQPTFGEPQMSPGPAEVLAGAGSRYGPTALLTDLHDVLARNERFAFVGKPCDIAALRNLARFDERVDRLVACWLTPVCGGFMPPEGMHDFLAREGVDAKQITDFRYRGFGCPGRTRLVTSSGEVREYRYTTFWGTDESQWLLPFRCKVCPDGIGEAADIAAADDWPGGSPDPATEDRDAGTNAVLVRTPRGRRLVDGAVDAGYLTICNDVDPRYLDSVQPHQVKKKYNVRARWDALASAGHLVPRSRGLRLEMLSRELSREHYERQRHGTLRRLAEGQASEARPDSGGQAR